MAEPPAEEKKPAPEADGEKGSGEPVVQLKLAEKADPKVKQFALKFLVASLLYCLVIAGWLDFSHNMPFQSKANFTLFAAFIVVAGAIERLLEPILVALPPNEKKAAAKATDEDKAKVKEENEVARADRTLIAYCIALAVGIAVSSLFGLYFMETMGVEIGKEVVKNGVAEWSLSGGDKWLRGLDIFITALIITGGTKPLHDMISSIEKKKEAAAGAAAEAG